MSGEMVQVALFEVGSNTSACRTREDVSMSNSEDLMSNRLSIGAPAPFLHVSDID